MQRVVPVLLHMSVCLSVILRYPGKWSCRLGYFIMPSFQRSIALLPLPFRCAVAILPFRSCRCRFVREWNCWKRLSVDDIWSDQNADWLSAVRQNGKNRIWSYLLGNGSYGTTAGGNSNGTTEFFYVSNVIFMALTKFLRNLCNGKGKTATEHWKLGISSYMPKVFSFRSFKIDSLVQGEHTQIFIIIALIYIMVTCCAVLQFLHSVSLHFLTCS